MSKQTVTLTCPKCGAERTIETRHTDAAYIRKQGEAWLRRNHECGKAKAD